MWHSTELFLAPTSKRFLRIVPFASAAKLLSFARQSLSGLRELPVNDHTVMVPFSLYKRSKVRYIHVNVSGLRTFKTK